MHKLNKSGKTDLNSILSIKKNNVNVLLAGMLSQDAWKRI